MSVSFLKWFPHFPADQWAVSWENQIFTNAKTNAQISCAVTAQLISTFVFATWTAQFLLYLYTKFQNSSFLLWLYRPVCVRPGQKSRRPVFLCHSSYVKQKLSYMKYCTIFKIMWATSWENQQCGFPTGPTQTELYKHRRCLETRNSGFRKQRNHTIR